MTHEKPMLVVSQWKERYINPIKATTSFFIYLQTIDNVFY